MVASGLTRHYGEQHAGAGSTKEMASGAVLHLSAGALIDAATATGLITLATGAINAGHLAGDLASGLILLNLAAGLQKTTATASGLVTLLATGNPSYKTPGGTDNNVWPVLRWTSAAGATANVWLPPVPIPNDYSTAGGMTLHVVGERSSAQATGGASGNLRFRTMRPTTSTGTTGSTSIISLTSAPVENTIAIASGALPATGYFVPILDPEGHASGSVDVLSAWLTYTRTS